LGGFTNGELVRTSGAKPVLYRARFFLCQTWGLGGGTEEVESGANPLAGNVDKNRVVMTLGNVSVLDIFDNNIYSHDPRSQFLNWSIMTHGAYDYAADARGYSWGGALEYDIDHWAVRAGRFIQPKEPNLLKLEPNIFEHYGDQIEIEHAHEIDGKPG
jgi:high affinity Mn2+ porin